MKIGLASLITAVLAFVAAANPSAVEVAEAGCTLTGTYKAGTDISTCSNVVINALTVPAGVKLDLTKTKDGATITFQGTTTFGTKAWEGPLIELTGSNLKVTGTGTLDGQGSWYWKQGTSISRPVFFRITRASSTTLSSFNIKNMPYRTFSVLSSSYVTISGLTLDSTAGDGLAKNTDGFDLGRNNHVTISGCKVYNQDDCLALNSGNNTIFSGNTCSGGHGISIGSIGGTVVDRNSIVNGVTVYNNKILNGKNGLRIKTIVDLEGLVTNANYTSNTLSNVKFGLVIRSDYSKAKGGYTGSATSKVGITGITINGLTGSATNVYDIKANSKVASNWKFSGIKVKGTAGTCTGQPSNIKCA